MKKIVMNTVIVLLMFGFFTNSARAFVFSDIPAFAQRVATALQVAEKKIADAQNWVKTAGHYAEMKGYIDTFQLYKSQFDSYQNKFNSVYKKISQGDYARNFNVREWDWRHLDDHILKTWRTFDEAMWDARMLTLKASRLFAVNPVYRKYVNDLERLKNEKKRQAKETEAAENNERERFKQRKSTLEELKKTNENLATASEPNAAELAALQNRLLLELVQNNIEKDQKAQEARRLDQDMQHVVMELQNMMEEAKRSDVKNLEYISNATIDK